MKKSILPFILTVIGLAYSPFLPLTLITSVLLISAYSSNEYSRIFRKKAMVKSILLVLVFSLILGIISSFTTSNLYPAFVRGVFTLVGMINLYLIVKYHLQNRLAC